MINQTSQLMNDSRQKKSRVSAWLIIGVLVLIALLIIWLTFSEMAGDENGTEITMLNTAVAAAQNLLT